MAIRTFFTAFVLALICTQLPSIAKCQVIVITAIKVGECQLSVEANDQWHTLRLRAHHPMYKSCDVDKESMLLALEAAFSSPASPMMAGNFSSLFMGRLIDYPWLSRYLADAARGDSRWDSKKGKPVSMGINKYVSRLLFAKDLIEPIEAVLVKGNYKIVGVTVEKVLVGSFREIPLYQGVAFTGKVPYDAQVWLRLERN